VSWLFDPEGFSQGAAFCLTNNDNKRRPVEGKTCVVPSTAGCASWRGRWGGARKGQITALKKPGARGGFCHRKKWGMGPTRPLRGCGCGLAAVSAAGVPLEASQAGLHDSQF
jgi:hypothetical protein